MALAAALIPAPAAATAAHGPLPATDEDVSADVAPLVVERITPGVIEPDSTVRVAGEVTNTTDDDITDVTVRIRYSRHPFTTRDELDEFASGEGWQPDARGPETELAGPLAPQESAGYVVSTDAEDLGLSDFGVYPLIVEAVDGAGTRLGGVYTFLPYTGEDSEIDAVEIAWVWPLADTPQRADDDTYLGNGLTASVGEGGRLGRLLAAGAQSAELSFDPGEEDEEDTAGEDDDADADGDGDEADAGGDAGREDDSDRVPLAWAVDPGTLDDIRRLSLDSYDVLEDPLAIPAETEPMLQEYEASEAAGIWLREARTALEQGPLISTPYAGPDLPALLRNGLDADAGVAVELGRETVAEVLGLEADPAFAAPAQGRMDDAVHEFLAESGATRFLLREESMPRRSWMSSTPTAPALLPAPDDPSDTESTALVADDGLAEVLSAPTWGPGESALAQQRFAAETAMIAGEGAGDDRVIVAAPDPMWDPAPSFAEGVLRASQDLPWLSPRALDDIDPPSADEESTRQALTYPGHAYEEELGSTYLNQIQDVRRDVRLFNSILVEDSDPFRPALLRLQSADWRGQEALAAKTRSLLAQSVQDRMDDVRIIPGEPVTLASKTGIIGVLVANDLEDEAVAVRLSMFSENSERLSVGDYTESFEIAPGAKTTVYVPLTARINGRTVLHLSLHNSEGEPISAQETLIPVNATGLGTQALLISGIGALILVAALAPRAVRKWVRRRAGGSSVEEAPAEDPQEPADTGTPADDSGGSARDAAAPDTPDGGAENSSADGPAAAPGDGAGGSPNQ